MSSSTLTEIKKNYIKKREFYVVFGLWGSKKDEELEQSLSDFFVSLDSVWLCLLRTYSTSPTKFQDTLC